MIKLRAEGTLLEIQKYIDLLLRANDKITILQISQPYKNRGTSEYHRVYIEIECKEKERE